MGGERAEDGWKEGEGIQGRISELKQESRNIAGLLGAGGWSLERAGMHGEADWHEHDHHSQGNDSHYNQKSEDWSLRGLRGAPSEGRVSEDEELDAAKASENARFDRLHCINAYEKGGELGEFPSEHLLLA